jgi:regulator of protease activity HflC (stomatin/prohibitin superfamily)
MICEILLAMIIAAIIGGMIALPVIKKLRHVFDVPEGWAGLIYRHGLYVRRNNAGRHVVWGFGWTMKMTDLRKASLLVAGQEVLTSDNVGLKLSLLVTCQVTDPAKAAHETQNWLGDLYHTAQLAVRAVVGGVTVEALLNQRLEIGAQLLARVQPDAAKAGVSVQGVEVKDVMLPADLKRAFADVLKAKISNPVGRAAQAAVCKTAEAGAIPARDSNEQRC